MSLPSGAGRGSVGGMTPRETMQRYFATWNARDFDAFAALLADEMTFAGPMGTADGPAEAREGIERLSAMRDHVEVIAMVADGPDVITWSELHAPGAPPVPVANWARVQDGRISRVRVTFDPRPLLG
jgi:hypothetical protein